MKICNVCKTKRHDLCVNGSTCDCHVCAIEKIETLKELSAADDRRVLEFLTQISNLSKQLIDYRKSLIKKESFICNIREILSNPKIIDKISSLNQLFDIANIYHTK